MTNSHSSFTTPQDGMAYDYSSTNLYPSKGNTPSAAQGSLQVPASEKDSSTSWEENDSDDELYSVDAYTYGRDDDDDEEDDDEGQAEERQNQTHKVPENEVNKQDQENISHSHRKTFDQDDDRDMESMAPNANLFRTSATNQRSSVNSVKSYSSHTKHHSFGYDRDRPEPSDSDSESMSESDSERPLSSLPPASATAAAPPIVPLGSRPPSTAAPPPVPVRSRPPSTAAAPPPVPMRSRPPSTAAASPPVPVRSRPPSTSFSSTRSLPKPSSPNSNRLADLAKSPESEVKNEIKSEAGEQFATLSGPSSPAIVRPIPRSYSSSSSSSFSAVPLVETPPVQSTDPLDRRVSSSEGEPSSTSNDIRSQSIIGHVGGNRNFPSQRLSGGRYSGQQQRGSSFSDLSDAELNEIPLDSRPSTPKRNSGIVASRSPVSRSPVSRSPVASTTNAGFPSSFFGGRPHPKSQQYQTQSGAPSPGTSPASLPVFTAPPEFRATPVSPAPTGGGVLNGSFSSLASSITGAFMGRGFGGGGSNAALPPPPAMSRSNSRTGMRVMTSSIGFEVRSSNNVSPERASMYSTMTTDSNMDLLLARLEAQNSILEVDAKRRTTNEAEMDRAIGHAKEESVSEDVDWDYWGALMHDYSGMAKRNPKQLTQMIQKGVPPALRGLIWQVLAKSKDGELEAKYAELLKATSTHEKQINRDMNRTFPNHEYFQAEGLGQESLFNVVKAYSLYDTEVGYCQGLSFVVGPLILNNMPDEEAFCVLVKLMSTYDMRGHFTPDMNTLQLRLYQFEQLMEETVPLVYKHFQIQGIRSTMYASQWFMTLFAYKFPLDLVFRVYDILFVEGIDSLLRFAIALLKANHDQILGHEFETLVEFLKNGLFEQYKNNPNLLVQDAYNVKVTPKKVTQYTQKYNAMIQRQQAELAAEESLRETNRQLSNDVRRLEGSLLTLNKEHVELARELITRKMEMAQLHDHNDVLTQKVVELTKIVDSQVKEVEDRFRAEIQALLEKNVEMARKHEQAEDQCSHLESLLIDTKMRYAESESRGDALARKLGDLRNALGGA